MVGNKRPLPLPERGTGELSRARKRWRTLLLGIREELCFRENAGHIHFETGTVCFRRLLTVQLVSMVKTVVSEEVKKALSFLHMPPRVIPGEENNPRIKLKFVDKVNQPVHTSFKVERQNSQQGGDTGLRIAICLNKEKIMQGPLSCAKIEVMALPGDFCKNVWDDWTREEFEKAILVNRDKKPPVFLGNHSFQLKNGEATINWLVFGDNSSWTRAKMFRLGIRVLNWGGERVKEGVTEPFPVRDRRMEASKKHHPPLSTDEIWRLEGIAKNGGRCKSLNQNNIHTVKDLLESYWKHETKLREILGGISEKSRAWKIIIGHAKECADLVDYNGALDQLTQLPKIPSISGAHLTCSSTYLHGTSSSQKHPLENQIINEDAVATFSGQLPPFQDIPVLDVGPLIHTTAGELQVEIPVDSYTVEDLLANDESTPNNSSHFRSRSNSFDAGSCEALIQGFIASMPNSEYVGPLTPRRSKKIKAVLRSICFLAVRRKRARIVPPGNQAILLGC